MKPPTSLTLGTPQGGRPLTDRQSRIRGGSWMAQALHASLVALGAVDN